MLSQLCSPGGLEDIPGERRVVVGEPSGYGQPHFAGENQQFALSEALGRIMAVAGPLPAQHQGSSASGDQAQEKSGTKNRFKEPANLSEMMSSNTRDGNENLLTSKKLKTPLVLNKKPPEPKEINGKAERFRCQICKDQEFSVKKRLYRHYCYAHYKKDLLQLIGDRKESCPFCEKKFRGIRLRGDGGGTFLVNGKFFCTI